MERVDGRFQKVEGTERELLADLVFLAMGFTGAQRTGLVEEAAQGARVTTEVLPEMEGLQRELLRMQRRTLRVQLRSLPSKRTSCLSSSLATR